MSLSPSTPVIVGVGQFTERIGSPAYRALSAVDIAAESATRAIEDAQSFDRLRAHIDAIATTRTFDDSNPLRAQPFGRSNNFPRSVANRLGIAPRIAVWEQGGGDSPQKLVNEFCARLADGECRMVLIAGAENISTARQLKAEGRTADWSEQVDGSVDNRGMGLRGLVYRYNTSHGLVGTPPTYGLCETARRSALGQTAAEYGVEMGKLFAPFTRVAAANPYASSAVSPYTAEELVTVGERNRMIASPYPQRLVARDQVNQGAALLLTTVGVARELGIDERKWVFLAGHAATVEREVMERQALGRYPAAVLACRDAMRQAGVTTDDLAFFDFYSCYPIAVSSVAIDGLGLTADDPRGLTVTGGLPYFGGPGNNYSMHAIATMVERLRAHHGTYGLIGANGGYLSKYAVGIYTTRPAPFVPNDSAHLQAEIDGWPAPPRATKPRGSATVETFTVVYAKGIPDYAVAVCRNADGARFLARTEAGDASTVDAMLDGDPVGRTIHVRATDRGNRFAFSEARLDEQFPRCSAALRAAYDFAKVERRGHLLIVTIDRPEVRNALHPAANEELAGIWDAFDADPDLWVAILTGAGSDAFSAGNDLKYTASGNPMWIPQSGFGGLTARVRTKPVIAAVNGHAMGGGMEMALACDIVVADERASFALSEVKVGVVAACGGLVRLPREIPRKIALEHILTGRAIHARRAAELGLVNRVTPAGEALAGALGIAEEILSVSPTSVRVSMKIVNDVDAGDSTTPSRHLDELYTSEDYLEGPNAFKEKRKPMWKNR
ncbi:acetyl-CoA acetyltransferase [Burkholderia paludis]|uniref:enoyl-CoA hydratase-related protein n=1 Tax=Burkholderia paludis TaxID=1506587 RepID=UPI0004DB604A|nr:enoyl-CoA hydratase-related protein [Burkholderia paludis]KFG93521.1 acetyl-CoA acetyltransferase [Burkholderia paludis]